MKSDRTQAQRESGLLVLATEMLGSAELAKSWLRSPARALAGMAPLEVASSEDGYHKVETLIFQLDHGVYV